jgi:hypothetical protein
MQEPSACITCAAAKGRAGIGALWALRREMPPDGGAARPSPGPRRGGTRGCSFYRVAARHPALQERRPGLAGPAAARRVLTAREVKFSEAISSRPLTCRRRGGAEVGGRRAELPRRPGACCRAAGGAPVGATRTWRAFSLVTSAAISGSTSDSGPSYWNSSDLVSAVPAGAQRPALGGAERWRAAGLTLGRSERGLHGGGAPGNAAGQRGAGRQLLASGQPLAEDLLLHGGWGFELPALGAQVTAVGGGLSWADCARAIWGIAFHALAGVRTLACPRLTPSRGQRRCRPHRRAPVAHQQLRPSTMNWGADERPAGGPALRSVPAGPAKSHEAAGGALQHQRPRGQPTALRPAAGPRPEPALASTGDSLWPAGA